MNPFKTGELISKQRKKLKMTQQELAEKLGVTNKAISRWETGRGYPDVEMIPLLADCLNLSVEELLSGEYNSLHTPTKKPKHLVTALVIYALSFIISLLFSIAIGLLNISDHSTYNYYAGSIVLYISLIVFFSAAMLWIRKHYLVFALSIMYTCVELMRLPIAPFSFISLPGFVTFILQFIPPVVFFIMLYNRKESLNE